MLETNKDKSYIQCGSKRIFKTRAGFIYACENGFLSIIQFIKGQDNFRIYHDGNHMHIDVIASFFGVSYKEIVQWRNHVWKRVYSKDRRRNNVHNPRPVKQLSIDLQVTLPRVIREVEIKGCFVVDKPKDPLLATGSMLYNVADLHSLQRFIAEPDEHLRLRIVGARNKPWKSYFSEFMTNRLPSNDAVDNFRYMTLNLNKVEERMTQQQRLARVKQKQRGYCLNYGMPESLVERNVAFAVTKFYEEEDKHEALQAKKKALINHELLMLEATLQGGEKHYKALHTATEVFRAKFKTADEERAKQGRANESIRHEIIHTKRKLDNL